MNSVLSASKSYRASNSHFFQLWCCQYSSAAASSKVNVINRNRSKVNVKIPNRSEENVIIPNRIHRGPTDILKVLEKNISFDFSGPSYKYFDDPHLAPYHERHARLYSFAKLSGQKAARWIRDEHPALFTQVLSDPPIVSYMPPSPINADTVTEEMLFQKIHQAKVSDAIKVFNIMTEKTMVIPQETQLALLELLCFYNCQDPIPMENAADIYYKQGKDQNPTFNSWNNDILVTTLFSSLQGMGSRPYSALIYGMFTYGEKARGDEMVQEAKANGINLNVHGYNALILRFISIYEKNEDKKARVMEILKEMNHKGVKPNLTTLNNCVDLLGRMYMWNKYSVLGTLLAEFNRLGIKPSMGTYGLVIRSLVGKHAPDPNLAPFVSSILTALKGKELPIRSSCDNKFFDWLMKSCVVIESLPNAIEAVELFCHSKNRLLCDSYKTYNFFNNFFLLLSETSDFETMLKYYKLLVPHVHSPGPEFYAVLFEACDANGAVAELPGFWQNYLASGMMNQDTLHKMLQVAVNLTGLPDAAASEVRPIIADLSDKYAMHKMDMRNIRLFDRTELTTEMCDMILILLARGQKWRTIQSCLQFMDKKLYYPNENSISQIIENCYNHGNPNMAVWVLKYCSTTFGSHVNLEEVSQKLMKSGFLSNELKKDLKIVINDSSSSSSSSSSDSESSDSDDDSSDSDSISIPRKPKPEKVKPDITKLKIEKPDITK